MTEIKAPEGGRPVSEMQRRIAEEIMNTEREMRLDYARRLEDVHPELQTHYLMLALAAMKAMREPTPEMEKTGDFHIDFCSGFIELWMSVLDAEISIAEGGKDGQ